LAPRLPVPIMHVPRTNQRERSCGSDECGDGVGVWILGLDGGMALKEDEGRAWCWEG